ncbi:miniconductance mechanosensitive channel [Geoalkalibacter ferrihydriticus]|nr:miniconductance mechanosensitive channel [Geoalkalibacter ferrihydriticus]
MQYLPGAILTGAILVSYYIARWVLVPLAKRLVERSPVKWDNLLAQRRVFDRAAHLAPAVVLALGLPLVLDESVEIFRFITRLNNVYFVFVGYWVFEALLNVGMDIYLTSPTRQHLPIRGLAQAIKLVVFLLCLILALSQIADRSPVYFISGLGAITAILLFIFKDPLLGLVAGVQITTMDLVRTGDWIEMAKHGADGDVIDVSLTTVRVQNWDRTITAIPAYELVSSSFKNWRGMSESGGRRIKRAISLDINTVRFVDDTLLERFMGIRLLRPYLEQKVREIEEHNRQHVTDAEFSVLANGRRLTNIGTFRAYCVAYLRNHPHIHPNLTFLVRQLAPTAEGLPLEIYVFVNDTRWVYYEGVQSDIFDHLLSVLPEFGLRAFQSPSGRDVREIGQIITRAAD